MDTLIYGLIYGYINIEYGYINTYLEWLCIQSYESSDTHIEMWIYMHCQMDMDTFQWHTHRDVNIHALLNGYGHIPVTHT